MQPNSATNWDDFQARQIAKEADEAAIAQPKRRVKASAAVAELLLQTIAAAGARRGRISRAEQIREATLLEVLMTTIRKSR